MIQEAIAQYLQKQRQVLFSPKAVLFDMDGVLYDSMRFHARAWYETATHHQLISTPELFYLYEGRTGECPDGHTSGSSCRDLHDSSQYWSFGRPNFTRCWRRSTLSGHDGFGEGLGQPYECNQDLLNKLGTDYN